jgi:hypothetical protein
MRSRPPSAIALLAAFLTSGAALADPPADVRAVAEQLYQDGYALDRAGRYAEACPKLEESDRLDPANGTKLELARCYESTRRPASAWALYVTVADADHVSGKNPEREALARAGALAIEPSLPVLTIVVPAAVASLPGIEIKRGSMILQKPAWGTATPIDLGEHRITASIAGKLLWEGRATAAKLGDRVEIRVPTLHDPGRVARAADADPSDQEGTTRRALLFVTGGVGALGIALGSAFGVTAISKWSDVKAAARTECRDPIHFKGCSVDVADKRADASLFATMSTVDFIIGGAAVVGMAVVWFTRSRRAPSVARIQMTPILGPGGAGGLMRGTF